MKKLKQRPTDKPTVLDMTSPVICSHCGKVYDLGAVDVIARYADCTMFRTPCCGREADDRLWKSTSDFTKVTEHMIEANGIEIDPSGVVRRLW